MTALMSAANSGHTDSVHALLANGVDINIQDKVYTDNDWCSLHGQYQFYY